MSLILYRLGIWTYFHLIKGLSPVLPAAKKWTEGRKNLDNELASVEAIRDGSKTIWIHCSSLGEFEQGRPVIERIKSEHPDEKICLSFFSPSGYDIRRNYELADFVVYFPSDIPSELNNFLNKIEPKLALFVKYDFWWNTLAELQNRKIPTYFFSCIIRDKHWITKWYSGFARNILKGVTAIFTQDKESCERLKEIGLTRAQFAGDTRIDRVLEIASKPIKRPEIEKFCGDDHIIICGSTWPQDHRIIFQSIDWSIRKGWKWIIAPHQLSEKEFLILEEKFQNHIIRYSALEKQSHVPPQVKVLLVDRIGMLNTLYYYADAVYIGGGFGKGIHNTLEPLSFLKPLAFGPKYENFSEAVRAVNNKYAKVIHNAADMLAFMEGQKVTENENSNQEETRRNIEGDLLRYSGATEIVYKAIKSHFS